MSEESLIKRLQNRHQIAEGIHFGEGLEQIRARIRSIDFSRSSALLEKQKSELFILSPEKADLAQKLQTYLQNLYPDIHDLTVILLGSAIHGGHEWRKIFNTHEDSDLDWIIAYKPEASASNLKKREYDLIFEGLLIDANTFLQSQHPKLKSCHTYNPDKIHIPHLSSIQDARRILLSFDEVEKTLFYFQPAFPKEKQQLNLFYVLQALADLSLTDHHSWINCTGTLIDTWKIAHSVKKKHVKGRNDQTVRSRRIAQRFSAATSDSFQRPFEQLILSTDRTRQSSSHL